MTDWRGGVFFQSATTYHPKVEPADFISVITRKPASFWFPLRQQ
jgi:hypothetical protein